MPAIAAQAIFRSHDGRIVPSLRQRKRLAHRHWRLWKIVRINSGFGKDCVLRRGDTGQEEIPPMTPKPFDVYLEFIKSFILAIAAQVAGLSALEIARFVGHLAAAIVGRILGIG